MSFEENINAILMIHIVFINTIVSCKWKLLIFIHFWSLLLYSILVYIFGGKEMFQGSSNINTPSETAPGTAPSETAPSVWN